MTTLTTERALFLTVPGFTFADETAFASDTQWDTDIAAGNIIPLQGVREVEPADFEDPIIETTSGEKIPTFEGQRGAMYKLLYPLDQHKLAKLLSGQNWGVIYGDRNNNIKATKLSDGTITGFTLSYFKVWKQDRPGADNAPYTLVDLQEDDPSEYDVDGIYLTPTWRVSRIDGVLQVDLTCGTIAAGVFSATIKYVDASNPNGDGSAYEKAISGLLVDNFKVYDQAGDLLTATTDYTVTEDAGTPGLYSVDTNAGTPITGGTCQVIATSAAKYNSEVETLT